MIELKDLALRAVNRYGVVHQKMKAIEELGELITELSREQDRRTSKEKVAEELADVIIMCEQLKIIYETRRVDRWVREKAERLQEMLAPEQVPKGYGDPRQIEGIGPSAEYNIRWEAETGATRTVRGNDHE